MADKIIYVLFEFAMIMLVCAFAFSFSFLMGLGYNQVGEAMKGNYYEEQTSCYDRLNNRINGAVCYEKELTIEAEERARKKSLNFSLIFTLIIGSTFLMNLIVKLYLRDYGAFIRP